MIEILPKLWVGNQADFTDLDGDYGTDWSICFAARDPWHRALLGYTGRGAPKEHPEYLFARRPNRLYMNLVDAADPQYIGRELVDEAMRFIKEQHDEVKKPDCKDGLLICCNQGNSRAPTLALLYLAPTFDADFEIAEAQFRATCYPTYDPGKGMQEFARQNWTYYRAIRWATGADLVLHATALDKAEQIWQRFCESMKTDPGLARDQLIRSLVTALSAAEPQQDGAHHGTAAGSTGPAPD